MRRSRVTLLVLLGASVLEALAWWLPLSPLGAVSPYFVLRLALAITGGALLARRSPIWQTTLLVGLASVLPAVFGWTVAVLTGMAVAVGAGPAVVLSVLTWTLGLGCIGAVVGFAIAAWRGPSRRVV